MSVTPFPRSLAPLPDESLLGYLLRLSHRLDLPAAQLARLTGLAPAINATVSARLMLALDESTAQDFARACRLSPPEAHALTLAGYAPRYPPTGRDYGRRPRTIGGILVHETWILSSHTRYCPACLAGDDSPIEQAYGGAWRNRWRLPVVFACTRHRALLRHTCPRCGIPAHFRGTGKPLMYSRTDTDLHPCQCRAIPERDSPAEPAQACGAYLGLAAPPRCANLPPLLDLQHRFDMLLDPRAPNQVESLGAETSAARYFTDLRLTVAALAASWPQAEDLADPVSADLITRHVHAVRARLRIAQATGAYVHDLEHYDRPPTDPATCASLMLLAAEILAMPRRRGADTLWRILRESTLLPPWNLRFGPSLSREPACSPAFHETITEIRAAQRLGRTPLPPLPPPPDFDPRHIPPYLLDPWYQDLLAAITAVKPRLIRRAAALRLAHARLGGRVIDAAETLEVPRPAAHYALYVIEHDLPDEQREIFERAVTTLARNMAAATNPTDYSRRRDALRTWSIDQDTWAALTRGIGYDPAHGPRGFRPGTDLGEGKRLMCTAWIWTQITHGEHIFAPALRPDLAGKRNDRRIIEYSSNRWRLLQAGTAGHYRPLRKRLDQLTTRLAETIDHDGDPQLTNSALPP
jgi:hypothetical protein